MAGVTLIATSNATYYYQVKKLLETAKPLMPLGQMAQISAVPLNSGQNARFTRLMQIAKATAALSEGVPADYATATQVTAQTFDVTVADWGKHIAVSSLLDDTFINPALTAYTEILGINAGQSMEFELQKTLCGTTTTADTCGCTPLVYDLSQVGTNNKVGVATSAGSTTSLVDTGRTEAQDYFAGGIITFTNPAEKNYGLSRRVLSNYTSGTTIYWTTAINTATSTSTNYRIGSLGTTSTHSSLAAGTDIYCADAVRRAVTILRKNMAMPMDGGFYQGTVDPDSEYGLTGDTTTGGFIDIHKYMDNTVLLDGEMGRAAGVRFVRETFPYALSYSANYDNIDPPISTSLNVNFILGRDALGRAGLTGQTDTRIITHRPGTQSMTDALEMFATMAWKTNFARLALNSNWCVAVITAPTRN